jgi:hypothetical protein
MSYGACSVTQVSVQPGVGRVSSWVCSPTRAWAHSRVCRPSSDGQADITGVTDHAESDQRASALDSSPRRLWSGSSGEGVPPASGQGRPTHSIARARTATTSAGPRGPAQLPPTASLRAPGRTRTEIRTPSWLDAITTRPRSAVGTRNSPCSDAGLTASGRETRAPKARLACTETATRAHPDRDSQVRHGSRGRRSRRSGRPGRRPCRAGSGRGPGRRTRTRRAPHPPRTPRARAPRPAPRPGRRG